MTNSSKTSKINRRQFLTHGCSLGVAASTLGTTLLSLGAARNVAAVSVVKYGFPVPPPMMAISTSSVSGSRSISFSR